MQTKTLVSQEGLAALPEDVQKFAGDNGLLPYLPQAIETTRQASPDAQDITATLKRDEYGDRYVDIHALVHDDPETEAQKYSDCMERWASFIPPSAAERIQLSTSLVGR